MSYNKETEIYEGYIYCITNKVNNKKYIGQTRTDIETRWRGHRSDANNPNGQKFAIHLAMNKYGIENFIIEQIEKIEVGELCELLDMLNEREQYYIKKYNAISPNGYNLTIGGESGNINDLKPVVQYDTFGNFINEYQSIIEAEIMTDGNHRAISACCKHRLRTSGGFVWEYKGNQPRIYGKIKRITYKVDQYSFDGKFIKTYDNSVIPAEELGGHPSNINSVCNGITKSAFGFIWRKHGEPFDKYETRERIRFINQNINQFDFDGNLICVYDDYMPFPEYVIHNSVVYDCCRGKCAYAYGYIWTFGEDKPNLKEIPDSIRPLYKYDLDGNFIEKYKNVYEASDILCVDKSGILNCIQGRIDSAYGFMWSLIYVDSMKPYKIKQATTVVKYDYDGNFIGKYKSMKDGVLNSTLKKTESISNCCYGKIEYTKDGVWRFENDPFEKFPLHKFCIVDSDNKIIYSSIFQKDLATYLDVDFRLVSAYIKNQQSYNNLFFKIIDVNKSA